MHLLQGGVAPEVIALWFSACTVSSGSVLYTPQARDRVRLFVRQNLNGRKREESNLCDEQYDISDPEMLTFGSWRFTKTGNCAFLRALQGKAKRGELCNRFPTAGVQCRTGVDASRMEHCTEIMRPTRCLGRQAGERPSWERRTGCGDPIP